MQQQQPIIDMLTTEQEDFCQEFGIPIDLIDFDRARRIQNAKQEYNLRVQSLLIRESRASTPEEKRERSKELTDYLGKGLEDLLKRAGVEFPPHQ